MTKPIVSEEFYLLPQLPGLKRKRRDRLVKAVQRYEIHELCSHYWFVATEQGMTKLVSLEDCEHVAPWLMRRIIKSSIYSDRWKFAPRATV